MTGNVGHWLRRARNRISLKRGLRGVWIDVGAHHGEETRRHALLNPELKIYALEPNLSAVAKFDWPSPQLFRDPNGGC